MAELPACCSVEGCVRRTWEGYEDDGHRICSVHQRQLKTWRGEVNQGRKGEADRPFVRRGDRLVANEHYDKRSGLNGGGWKPPRLAKGTVEAIRREYRPGTVAVLAERYGVSKSTIYAIARGGRP